MVDKEGNSLNTKKKTDEVEETKLFNPLYTFLHVKKYEAGKNDNLQERLNTQPLKTKEVDEIMLGLTCKLLQSILSYISSACTLNCWPS